MKRKNFLGQVRFDEKKVQKARRKVFFWALLAFFAILVWGAFSSNSEAHAAEDAKSVSGQSVPKQALGLQVSESNSAAGSAAISASWPPDILKLADIIVLESSESGVDPDLMAAVIFVESWFNPENPVGYERCPDGPSTSSCTSRSGAIGPAQVMPFHFKPGEDARNVRTNIGRGAEILSSYTAVMGSVRGGLAAYYCGPNTVGWVDPSECWRYADKVLEVYVEKT